MLQPHEIDQMLDQPLYSTDQDELGFVGQVYLDGVTGQPAWAAVRTDALGTQESLVPLADATVDGGRLTVPYDKATVSAAPRVVAENGQLSQQEAAELDRHYGRRGVETVDGPLPGSTDVAMIRSEEQLHVATTTRASERVRLRKYVVTEERTITVSIRREELRLEREPITDVGSEPEAAAPSLRVDAPAEQYEMVLHEEQVFVEKRVVPVERVTLTKEVVTEQKQITEQVRREQIETDLDGDADPAR